MRYVLWLGDRARHLSTPFQKYGHVFRGEPPGTWVTDRSLTVAAPQSRARQQAVSGTLGDF